MADHKKTIAFCGGHHTSALPIIDSLIENNKHRVVFIGKRNSFENDKNDSLEYLDIQKRAIKFYELKAPKIYKKNLFKIFKIFGAIIRSLDILKREEVNLVVSFGGYLAFPVVVAAYLLRIKIITHEQTVVTGFGNKFISLFADLVLVTWQTSLKYFPINKTKVIGLPLRKALFHHSESLFPISNPLPTILITCGKTGSHVINSFILNNLEELLSEFNIIHQSGDYSVTQDFDKLERKYQKIKKNVVGTYYLRKFLSDEEVSCSFRQCEVVVCRSGAHTIYEILHFEKKALLIPISWVSHNEQNLNAQIIYDSGLGLILPEDSLNYENFKQFLDRLVNNTFILKDKSLLKLVQRDSTKLFIDEIQRLLS